MRRMPRVQVMVSSLIYRYMYTDLCLQSPDPRQHQRGHATRRRPRRGHIPNEGQRERGREESETFVLEILNIFIYIYVYIYIYTYTFTFTFTKYAHIVSTFVRACCMGWLRLVGSPKIQVSLAEFRSLLYGSVAKETYVFKEPTQTCVRACCHSRRKSDLKYLIP